MTLHPVRFAAGCPRCHADVEFDLAEGDYACVAPCGYRRKGLMTDAKDLVVIAGKVDTRNGDMAEMPTAPGGEKAHSDTAITPYAPDRRPTVTLAALARELGMSQAGIQNRGERLRMTFIEVNGHRGVKAEDADAIRAYVPRVVGDGWRTSDRKKATGDPNVPVIPDVRPAEPPATPAANTCVVKIRSGGTITLTIDVPWIALSPSDRALVFGLIDELTEYAGKD